VQLHYAHAGNCDYYRLPFPSYAGGDRAAPAALTSFGSCTLRTRRRLVTDSRHSDDVDDVVVLLRFVLRVGGLALRARHGACRCELVDVRRTLVLPVPQLVADYTVVYRTGGLVFTTTDLLTWYRTAA